MTLLKELLKILQHHPDRSSKFFPALKSILEEFDYMLFNSNRKIKFLLIEECSELPKLNNAIPLAFFLQEMNSWKLSSQEFRNSSPLLILLVGLEPK